MEQLTKNQAVATSQDAVQNQNEPQLRDENAHNDKSVHGVLKIGRAVQQECRDRPRMPSSACKKKDREGAADEEERRLGVGLLPGRRREEGDEVHGQPTLP